MCIDLVSCLIVQLQKEIYSLTLTMKDEKRKLILKKRVNDKTEKKVSAVL
jgi:hypothetical protein